ncbi:hypothetical protein [Nonomuraea bangladeshensis]|uniref:hypothetical protein n=1 Tax=Nonomuraea bangladeshensis TaxID=404385 RepID=UPI003C2CEC87
MTIHPVSTLPATHSQGNPVSAAAIRSHTRLRTRARAILICTCSEAPIASSARRTVESEAALPNTLSW